MRTEHFAAFRPNRSFNMDAGCVHCAQSTLVPEASRLKLPSHFV